MKINKKIVRVQIKSLIFLIIFCLQFTLGFNSSIITAYADENEKVEFNKLFITEDEYEKTMKEVVQVYLDEKREDGYLKIDENTKLYYQKYSVENPKATIVISHGFSESLEKYREIIYYFLKSGYSVYGIEHRGHGRSGSLGVIDKSQVNITDFNYYVSDFKKFIDDIVKPNIGQEKMLLYAHSMGGAIGAKFLEKYPEYFDAAILNAPMLEIDTGNTPEFLAESISWIYTTFSFGDKYVATQKPYNLEYNLEKSCTSSDVRYKYYYDIVSSNNDLQRGGASYNWLRNSIKATKEITKQENASKIEIPVLLFQAEKDTYVKPRGQNMFAQYAKNCKVILSVGSKHETYREKDSVLKPYLNNVFDFYNKNLKTE
ncbi:alpha/beta fold hydrolase [Clostridium uliginosum]|uniref:Lysophospholipase n=1 Tax=Clostridium uliginosum TaxID=119641 RepID=A0A1I1H667_9CLOT|nr:alpha/beta hydrolase [Clostridium uliginosum]SFC19444.1 lysophospholipase [Clostridium uliginosum]